MNNLNQDRDGVDPNQFMEMKLKSDLQDDEEFQGQLEQMIFMEKMQHICFRAVAPKNQPIKPKDEQALQNCYFRFIQSYRILGEIVHNQDDDEDELDL